MSMGLPHDGSNRPTPATFENNLTTGVQKKFERLI